MAVPGRAVGLCPSPPRRPPERELSASSPLHRPQAQPSLSGLDFQVGLKKNEPKDDSVNANLVRLPLEMPGKRAEDI